MNSFPLLVLLLTGLTLGAAETGPASGSDTPRPYPERLQWWAEARFGMFIHWGPVSLKGAEISWSLKAGQPLNKWRNYTFKQT